MSDKIPDVAAPSQPLSPNETSGSLRDARPYTSAAAWLRFLLPAVLGLTADLWAKAYCFPEGIAREPVTQHLVQPQGRFGEQAQVLIPKVLNLQTTANEGAVFGMGQGHVPFFVAFSVVALALIGWVFVTSKRKQIVLHLALGMIAAGALGNLYDRATYGAVRDFLRFTVDWYPWIFNIADALLCVGVPILMLCWVLAPKEAKKAAAKG